MDFPMVFLFFLWHNQAGYHIYCTKIYSEVSGAAGPLCIGLDRTQLHLGATASVTAQRWRLKWTNDGARWRHGEM